MPRAAHALRSALQEYLVGEGAARLRKLRDPQDGGRNESRGRGLWLLSESAQQALQDARGNGELTDEEAHWLARHIIVARHSLEAHDADAQTREALRQASLGSGIDLDLPQLLARMASTNDESRRASSARELDAALQPIALLHVRAHAHAEAHLLVQRKSPTDAASTASQSAEPVAPSRFLIVSPTSPEVLSAGKRDFPEATWMPAAAAFLAETDAAADDAVRFSVRGLRSGNLIDWPVLLRGLRAPDLDSPSGARDRWRRAAAWLNILGFERELNARVRAEPARDAASPLPVSVLLDVPRDARVAQSAIDYGVASDLFAAEGVARALGNALVLPGMPVELRWPVGANPAGVLGALAQQLWGERPHLRRVQGMTESEAERVGRVAGTIALLSARVWTALSLVSLDADETLGARGEAMAAALSRALCCEVTPAVAGLLGANRVLCRVRAQHALGGLALHVALRERCDDDWYRNAESADFLRNGCGRGNLLSPAAWLEELGGSLLAAGRRGVELVT
jgi:hypothetical protein